MRNNTVRRIILSFLVLLGLIQLSSIPGLSTGTDAASQENAYELPAAVKVELDRIAKTYAVLDLVAEKVWPGWTNYREFPFMMSFENGLRVMVGHPRPPKGFTLLPGVQTAGKTVHVDTRRLEPLELRQPLSCGGGISRLGTGAPLQTVSMSYRQIPPEKEAESAELLEENRILIYIHELFHCFQDKHVLRSYPNFRLNPDTNYAVYSEIEGKALENAYKAADTEAVQKFLQDFLIARKLKRKDISEFLSLCEATDEVMEGTAVYSEVRTLEILSKLQASGKTSLEFKGIDSLRARYQDQLRETRENTYSYLKCYQYGCFQALLLQRLFPEWQAPFSQKASFLDQEIGKYIPVEKGAEKTITSRFQEIYDFDEVYARHHKAISERDSAYKELTSRKGRAYIVSFKPIRQFLSTLPYKEDQPYKIGLMNIFPQGVGNLKVNDIEIICQDLPTELSQLYHLKIVDTDWETREESYNLTYTKKEGEDIFYNAVLKTPVFTLKAPKIRLKEKGQRVKVWILARVKQQQE